MRFGTHSTAAVLYAAIVLSFFFPAPANGQGRLLTRHMRDEVSRGQAALLGRLSGARYLRLNIALPLRNESELDDLLERIYDPQSSSYRRFLSVEEFTDRFGPSQEDYDAVTGFAQANGLTVAGAARNRMILDVAGTVANIERAFQVEIGVYRHPTEDRTFYAPDREPTADLPFALWHITGLDNFSIPRPAGLTKAPEASPGATGSGPGGNYIGSDLRAAYYGVTGPAALTGAGQSVGLVEFGGYNIKDVETYFKRVGPAVKVLSIVVGVSTDGSSLKCTGKCDDSEQALDIEQAISMAPGLKSVRVYVAKTSDVDIFNKMAEENKSKSLACSWGWRPADPASDDPIFKEFAAQGQNLFVASGDNGSYQKKSGHIYPGSQYVYPADDAYVTSVGGTVLTTEYAGGPWKSETAWHNSGGGISPNRTTIPSYQETAGVITTANKGSKVYRNCPDVAAEADTDNYICYDGACEGGWGGTSFAAPRWAGFLALVNEKAGGQSVGFINPAIYSIGMGSSYARAFHDIISGSNGMYSAKKGYDLVTGWGSPNGTYLIDSLAP